MASCRKRGSCYYTRQLTSATASLSIFAATTFFPSLHPILTHLYSDSTFHHCSNSLTFPSLHQILPTFAATACCTVPACVTFNQPCANSRNFSVFKSIIIFCFPRSNELSITRRNSTPYWQWCSGFSLFPIFSLSGLKVTMHNIPTSAKLQET